MRDFAAILARTGRLIELACAAGADEVEAREAFADVLWMAEQLECRLTKPSSREIRARMVSHLRRLRGMPPREQTEIMREIFSEPSRSAFFRHLAAARKAVAVPVPSGTPALSNESKRGVRA